MSQNDFVIADGNGATVLADLSAAFQAAVSQSKGSSAPSTAYAGQPWLDDSATPWVLKIYDGADWIIVGFLNATANTWLGAGGLLDANGLSLLQAITTASAVNYLTLANAATGAGPELSAEGSDTDVPLLLTPKGAAGVKAPFGSAAAPTWTFQGDADLGMFRKGANALGFAANGAEVAALDANGLDLASGEDYLVDGAKIAGAWQEDYTTAQTALSTTMPLTGSTPTVSQGTQIASIASVVVAAGEKVKIEGRFHAASSDDRSVIGSLFRGSTCIDTFVLNTYSVDDIGYTEPFAFLDDPGAGTYTYTLRVGPHSASSNTYLNAINGSGGAGPATMKSGFGLRIER